MENGPLTTSLLRKFKVVRCPIEGNIFRSRAFEKHMKEHHHKHPNLTAVAHRAQKEESCLLCSSHPQPAITEMANTRRGNDHFIRKHAAHLPNRLPPLTELEKESVRQVLNSNNAVDLDATPIPTVDEAIAIGSIEQQREAEGESEEEEEEVAQSTHHNTTADIENVFQSHIPITTYTFSDIPMSTDTVIPNLNDLESTLFLDEQDPHQHEPEAAQRLNDSYRSIYEPGLRYPSPPPPQEPQQQQQQDSQSQTQQQQESQQQPPSPHPTANTEAIPLLSLSLDHTRQVNQMKNVMLTQIMKDNITLWESKVQARKRALQAMETLFQTRTQEEPASDDISLELSRIIHLKNKLIEQLLRESATLHPHVYRVMMQN